MLMKIKLNNYWQHSLLRSLLHLNKLMGIDSLCKDLCSSLVYQGLSLNGDNEQVRIGLTVIVSLLRH